MTKVVRTNLEAETETARETLKEEVTRLELASKTQEVSYVITFFVKYSPFPAPNA